jgi:cytochrome c peroxidase
MRITIALALCGTAAAAVAAWAQGGQTPASDQELRDLAASLFEPIPATPPDVPGLAQTPEQVELGKMLYFERRLSESHNISCDSCHSLGTGGVDLQETSIGHLWQRGPRNAPTVLNSVYNTAQFWDGRAGDLVEQAGGPLVNPIEMGTTAEHAVEMIEAIPGYAEPFARAYPDQDDPINFENLRQAIAAYEATLVTPNAPFDRWLTGEADALSAEQKEGLQLFVDSGCASCHSGMNLGGQMYAPFGVVEKPGADLLPPADRGRFEVTKTVDDEYVFKVPMLRNIELTPPYFHSGKSCDLGQAVGVMAASQLGVELASGEVEKITAFLRTLTGDQPEVIYPILPPSVAETPHPRPLAGSLQ